MTPSPSDVDIIAGSSLAYLNPITDDDTICSFINNLFATTEQWLPFPAYGWTVAITMKAD